MFSRHLCVLPVYLLISADQRCCLKMQLRKINSKNRQANLKRRKKSVSRNFWGGFCQEKSNGHRTCVVPIPISKHTPKYYNIRKRRCFPFEKTLQFSNEILSI